jgi:hypothetical protein
VRIACQGRRDLPHENATDNQRTADMEIRRKAEGRTPRRRSYRKAKKPRSTLERLLSWKLAVEEDMHTAQ